MCTGLSRLLTYLNVLTLHKLRYASWWKKKKSIATELNWHFDPRNLSPCQIALWSLMCQYWYYFLVFVETMCMGCLNETSTSPTCLVWRENCLSEQKWYELQSVWIIEAHIQKYKSICCNFTLSKSVVFFFFIHITTYD